MSFCSCAGFHVCAAGWFSSGRVGYPIVKAGANCGFGKVGIVDYGYRLNKSEKWDVYCYNPDSKYSQKTFYLLSSSSRNSCPRPGSEEEI